jgi:hypothetical protein
MGQMRNASTIVVGKPEGKRPFGRSGRKWDDINGVYSREMGWEVADWIRVAQDKDQCRAVVNTVMNLRDP